jgi:hypothetical protein
VNASGENYALWLLFVIQLGSRWVIGDGNSARFLVGGNEECLKHQTQHYEDERLFLKPILPLAQNRQPILQPT